MFYLSVKGRVALLTALEYQINVQQILFKFWVLAHLHAYFVLHNSTEKNTEFFVYYLFVFIACEIVQISA